MDYWEKTARANIVLLCKQLAYAENYERDNQIMAAKYELIAREVGAKIEEARAERAGQPA